MILIEQVKFKTVDFLAEREVFWQNQSRVYLSTCKKCGGQYVGKSKTKFKLRHSNHKQEIKNQMGGLGNHYGGNSGCGYDNFSVIIIEQVKFKGEVKRRDRPYV